MISVIEIKKELLSALKELYPKGYAFYGLEVTEGYAKPSFFTQLVPVSSETETNRIKNRVFIYEITYFQETVNEIDALQKVSEIEGIFGVKVKIKDRYANVTEFDYDFIGKSRDILQVKITFSFKDAIEQKAENHEPVRDVKVRTEMEG